MGTAQWVLKNAELYGNLPQEARYRVCLSSPKVLSYSLWLLPPPHGQSWWPVSASAISTSCAAQPDIVEPRMLYVWTVWPLLWLSIYDDFMHLTPCPGIVFTCLWKDLWAALAWPSSFTRHPYADFFFFEIHKDLKNPCMWNLQPLEL